jgi:hypothetical protein
VPNVEVPARWADEEGMVQYDIIEACLSSAIEYEIVYIPSTGIVILVLAHIVIGDTFGIVMYSIDCTDVTLVLDIYVFVMGVSRGSCHVTAIIRIVVVHG